MVVLRPGPGAKLGSARTIVRASAPSCISVPMPLLFLSGILTADATLLIIPKTHPSGTRLSHIGATVPDRCR